MANLKIQKWLKGHRTRMGQPEKDGNWEMESHKRQSFLSSLPGYLSWYGSPLWGTVFSMPSSLPSSETPALCLNSRFLGKGCWVNLNQGGTCLLWSTEARGMGFIWKQLPGRHSELGTHSKKSVPIANVKFLFILIILCSLNSKILQKASITDALPEKPNTIMYIYTYTKFLFVHILTYHFLL